MATHDYNIANGTGAAVRADINNALAAIQSTNSNSSAPSTTVAFQLWADTSSGTLKIRNAANSAFIELMQLDGTMTMEDGSASSPGLAFRDDLNTGIFSSAADKFNIATGGVERMELGTTTIFNEDGADVDFRIESDGQANMFFVDASTDRIGICQSSPNTKMHIVAVPLNTSTISTTNCKQLGLWVQPDGTASNTSGNIYTGIAVGEGHAGMYGLDGGGSSATALGFFTGNSSATNERIRIDGAGNVGIGVTAPSNLLHLRQELNAGTNGTGILQIENTRSNTGSGAAAITFRTNEITSGFSGVRAQIAAEYDGASNVSGRLAFLTVNSSGSFQEVMRLDDSGLVGIGTTSPSAQLESQGNNSSTTQFSGFQGLRIQNANGSAHGLTADINFVCGTSTDNRGAVIGAEFTSTASGNALYFATNPNSVSLNDTPQERMRINSSGEVGIGKTATVGVKLDVTTTGNAHAARVHNSNAGFANLICDNDAGSGTRFFIDFRINNSIKGSITSDGSTTSFNQSSDYRLKENVTAISDGITRLKTLKPSRFNFIADAEKTVDGFLAHEVTAVPEAITGTKDEIATEDNDGLGIKKGDPIYQSIDQSKLVPLLVAAVQELISKVEALEAA